VKTAPTPKQAPKENIAEHLRAKDADLNLRLIVETIPTLAWSAAPDGSADFLNQRWLDYAGMSAEQAAGWGWTEAIHPDDRKELVEYWQSCLASGVPVETEARMRRYDSAYRWFLFRANPLRDATGKIIKWCGTNIDIEDRKQREEALRASEHSWRDIVDNIPGLVATTGAMGEVEFLNRQTLEYFGKTTAELKNWAPIDAVHPDDLPRILEARKKSIEAGLIYEVEHRCRRADGVYRWFQVRGFPVRDTENKITAWYLLLTDIEDRKHAAEELKRSEEFLAEGQRLSGTGSFSWCVATDEITWSEQLYRIFEFDQHLPVTLERIASRVYPDDLPLLQDMIERARRAASDFEYEHRLLMPDQSVKHIHLFAHATRDKYGRLEYVGAAQDVTQRRLAEEALQSSERNLRLMIDVIPTFVHVLRTDGSVLYVNQAVLDYTGLTLEDVRKEDYRARVFHPEDVERLREDRREALTRAVPFETEQRVLGKDGRYRWFLVRYNPWVEQGQVRRWYVSATEIESRKQEEERVRQENVRLEERTRIARELHDTLLQTCLAALFQLTGAVGSLPPDSRVKSKFDPILQLMEQGVEEGRKAIQCLRSSGSRPLDLVAALSAVRQEFLAQPSVDFRVSVVGQQQPLRPAIEQEIYSIGREALVNAFCHSGAKRIDLELDYVDSNLSLRVRDNGRGIDTQVLDGGREGHWGLTGMRERAARIGGLLKISSNASAGTEIKLSIPSDVAFQA
jgi:PAS domain S-box-containing protein